MRFFKIVPAISYFRISQANKISDMERGRAGGPAPLCGPASRNPIPIS